MRLIAVFVIIVLVTGVMLMSIPDNAFAGKDEKRVNITVRNNIGTLPGIECLLFESDGTPISNADGITNNGGKVGIWFPDSFDSIKVKCKVTFSGVIDTLKHTSFVNFHLV